MRPSKTRISPVCVHDKAFGPWLPFECTSEDSDQTGRMPRLIRDFAGRKGYIVGFVMLQLNSTADVTIY